MRGFVRAWLRVGSASLLLFAASARAEPLRAIIRVGEVNDYPLVERVRGQISDLEVHLFADATSALEASFVEQLEAARELAELRAAQLVVWFARSAPASAQEPTELDVCVMDLSADRVLVRSVERGRGPLAQSAQEEAAALVVRSAFKASLAGAALGEPRSELAAEEPPVAEPARSAPPPAPAPAPAPVPVKPVRVRPRRAWLLGLGALGGLDGATEWGHYALAGRAAHARGALEFGLRGGWGIRAPVAAQLAELSLSQHRLAGYAAYVPFERDAVRLALAAGVGLQMFVVRVPRPSDQLRARESRSALPGVYGELTFHYLPRWTGRRAGLGLSAGLEAFPSPLALGYRSGDQFVRVRRLWPVQPLWALELTLLLGRGSTPRDRRARP